MEKDFLHNEHIMTMLLDAACHKIVQHLLVNSQQFIMLKGATIAGWLYANAADRTYVDLDILVPRQDESRTIGLLRQLGYEPLLDADTVRSLSPEEQPLRNSNGTVVDLHVALKGIQAAPDDAWQVLADSAISWDWSGTMVPALAPAARAMHLALHLAQGGLADRKAATDLQLGLDKLDTATWTEACELARRLDAIDAFTAGLALLPDGTALVRALRLTPSNDLSTHLRAQSAPQSVLILQRALAARSWRQRLGIAWREFFPSAEWMRAFHLHESPTRWGLFRARVVRPIRVAADIPRALVQRHRYSRNLRRNLR